MRPSFLLRFSAGLLLSASAALAEATAARPVISEDFENTAVGAVPAGYTKTGSIGVVDDVAHSGKHSLRMDPAVKGARKITKQGSELTALGGQFWGRLYYKLKLPVPAPVIPEGKTSGIIHSTMVSGLASSPLASDPIEFRMLGSIFRTDGTFRYLFNVQPRKRPEFGVTAKAPSKPSDGWVLAEWSVDHATQSYQFFVDGTEMTELAVKKGEGQFAGAEVPAIFESLSFGFTNYQPATGEGFTVWIDDLALGKERLGPVPAPHTAGK